jgi:hypothetical protein
VREVWIGSNFGEWIRLAFHVLDSTCEEAESITRTAL